MKILAREFMWFVCAGFLSLPLAFLFLWMLSITTDSEIPSVDEKIFINQLYIIGLIVSFLSIYLLRLVRGAILILVSPK